MGKKLIIKGADFSQVAIEDVIMKYLAERSTNYLYNPNTKTWVDPSGTATYNIYIVPIPSGATKLKISNLGGSLGAYATSGYPCFSQQPTTDRTVNMSSYTLGKSSVSSYDSVTDSVTHTLVSGTTYMFVTSIASTDTMDVVLSYE